MIDRTGAVSETTPGHFSTFFKIARLGYMECAGGGVSSIPHLRIKAGKYNWPRGTSITLPVWSAVHAKEYGYGQSLQEWFTWRLLPHRISSGSECWHDAWRPTCGGKCTSSEVVLALPQVLIIHMDHDDGHPMGPWQVSAKSLHAGPSSLDVYYDYVGLTFSTSGLGAHHTCWFTPDGQNLYDYDDTQHTGQAQRLPAFSVDQIQESLNHPNISGLIYALRRGNAAQQRFLNHQQQLIKKELGIDVDATFTASMDLTVTAVLNRSGWVELDGKERFWREWPLAKSDWLDYQSQSGPDAKLELSSTTGSDSDSNGPPSEVHCRCGRRGPPDQQDQAEHGLYVKCRSCQRLSHIACQRMGWAELIGVDNFTCHSHRCSQRRTGHERGWRCANFTYF